MASAKISRPEGASAPLTGRRAIRQRATESLMSGIFTVCGCLSVVAVVLITVYMVALGAPGIGKIGVGEFLFGTEWFPTATTKDPSFGILPMILSSILATGGAVLIGVPIGLFTAIYLAEFARGKTASVLRAMVSLLAGIPSVVYGLVGMIVVVPAVAKVFGLPSGSSLFSAILVLAVMILPTIVSISENALRAVPKEYREASLAMGTTRVRTIFKVVLPAAKSGVAAGVVLGIGRAVGETMAVIMVAGNAVNMPALFQSVRLLTTGIAMEMGYAGGLHREALFGIGLVLFVFIMAINIVLNRIIKSDSKEERR